MEKRLPGKEAVQEVKEEKQEFVDLHVHSTCSDGTMTPEELVAYACEKKLKAFALTDHDTTAGLERARKAAEGTGLEVVSGIEFSTVYRGRDVHVVGLDIDETHPDFAAHLVRFRTSRERRNEAIVRKMQEDGFDISGEQMRQRFGNEILTRAHFARYLMEQGYVEDMAEAFRKYLGEGCIYHIPREKITPQEVVRLVAATGGIPVLAHPMQYHFSEEELGELIHILKQEGLIGIEALYSTHTQEQEAEVRKLARQFGLEISGGSDFHGTNKPNLDLAVGYGNLRIPAQVLDSLRARRAMRNKSGESEADREQL